MAQAPPTTLDENAGQASSAQPRVQMASKHGLPEYEPPKYPLSENVAHDISGLDTTTYWAELDKRLKGLLESLPNDAAEINERLTERHILKKNFDEKRRRDRDTDQEDGQDEDAELAKLKDTVTRMTDRMETAMRKAIDGHASLQQMHAALQKAKAAANTSTQQSTIDVTQTGQEDRLLSSIAQSFSRELESAGEQYCAKSLYMRYGEHNAYVTFKQMVHNSRYATDEAPSVPAASTWFSGPGDGPLPSATGGFQGNNDDDDEDIQISRAHISTKCAITLQEFQDPVQSSKCQHSFERVAILQMMNQQSPRSRRAGARREVQCPMPGCLQVLGEEDLRTNALLVRKIKRIQRMKELELEQGFGQDSLRTAEGEGEEIDIDSGDDIDDVPSNSAPATRIKTEAASQAAVRPRPREPDDEMRA